jgi:hypothetical protein
MNVNYEDNYIFFTYPPIHPSTNLPTNFPIIYLLVFTYSPIYRLLTYLSIHQPTYLFASPIYPSIYPCIT